MGSTAQRSVYVRGGEDGLRMAPLLILVMLFMGLSSYQSWALAPFFLSAVAVPVLLARQLRRSYADDGYRSTFSALWLQGICIFFFGGLLMSATAFILLRWVVPDYIPRQVSMVAEMYGSSADPEAQATAQILDHAIEVGALPTAIEVTIEMLWATVFSGSLLSMIVAWFVRLKVRMQQRQGAVPPEPPVDFNSEN